MGKYEFLSEEVYQDASELIGKLVELSKKKTNIFRGYGKSDELLHNLVRDKDWTDREVDFLLEFEKYGLQYISAANNSIDLMSNAQHYGLPTRLLDFTYNPFIALSFALHMPKASNYRDYDNKTYYYIIYCDLSDHILINSLPITNIQNPKYETFSLVKDCVNSISTLNNLNRLKVHPSINKTEIREYFISGFLNKNLEQRLYMPGLIDTTRAEEINKLADEMVEKFIVDKLLFIDPIQSNQRVIMQQGLFMLPYEISEDKHMEILQKNMCLIKIEKSLRVELLDYLDKLGLNTFRLMPDLQSVSYAIKRKITEDRTNKSQLFKKRDDES